MKNFFYNLQIFHSRLLVHFSEDKHLHKDRFAYDHELAPISRDTPSGLLLGIDRFNRYLCIEKTANRPYLGNIGIFGPTGSGKTIREIKQIKEWGGPIIVNDIKFDLSNETVEARKEKGPVYFLQPADGVGHHYDPLDGIYAERKLYKLAYHLLYNPNDRESVFTERATKMLTQILLASRLIGERPLPFVGRVINLGVNGVARILSGISPDLATKFLDAEYKAEKDFEEDRFRSSAWGTLSARLYPLLTEDIMKCFNGSDFTMKDVLFSKQPITVYLRWHESDLLSLSPLIKFVWESMLNELITAYDLAPDKSQCQNVLVSIEEAGRTGIPNLPEHASTVRSRGISIDAVFQDRSQAVALYGPDRAKTLFSNLRTQIYHRQDDLDTALYLEKRLGSTSGFAHSKTEHEGGTSQGESEQRIPLLSAQYIMYDMPDDEIIGFHGRRPFLANRIPPLTQRQHTLPLTLSPLPPITQPLTPPNGEIRLFPRFPRYQEMT